MWMFKHALLLWALLTALAQDGFGQYEVCDDATLPKWRQAKQTWSSNPTDCDSVLLAMRLMMRVARELNAPQAMDTVWMKSKWCEDAFSVPYQFEKGLFHMQFEQWQEALFTLQHGERQAAEAEKAKFLIPLAVSAYHQGSSALSLQYLADFVSSTNRPFNELELTNLTYLLRRVGRADIAWNWLASDRGISGQMSNGASTIAPGVLMNALTIALDIGNCGAACQLYHHLAEAPVDPELRPDWYSLLLDLSHQCPAAQIDRNVLNAAVMQLTPTERAQVIEASGVLSLLLPALRADLSPLPFPEGMAIDSLVSAHEPSRSASGTFPALNPVDAAAKFPVLIASLVALLATLNAWVARRLRKRHNALNFSKKHATDLLISHLTTALQAGGALDDQAVKQLEHALLYRAPKGLDSERLTFRQAQIYRLLQRGLTHKEIAIELQLSVKYVYNISSSLNALNHHA